jgi:hypothetical protein
VLSFGYLSLHEQRKVTRRRAASGTIVVEVSPQAIPNKSNSWIPAFAGMTTQGRHAKRAYKISDA